MSSPSEIPVKKPSGVQTPGGIWHPTRTYRAPCDIRELGLEPGHLCGYVYINNQGVLHGCKRKANNQHPICMAEQWHKLAPLLDPKEVDPLFEKLVGCNPGKLYRLRCQPINTLIKNAVIAKHAADIEKAIDSDDDSLSVVQASNAYTAEVVSSSTAELKSSRRNIPAKSESVQPVDASLEKVAKKLAKLQVEPPAQSSADQSARVRELESLLQAANDKFTAAEKLVSSEGTRSGATPSHPLVRVDEWLSCKTLWNGSNMVCSQVKKIEALVSENMIFVAGILGAELVGILMWFIATLVNLLFGED
ncbi:hypothetical protein CYMTET_11369 [Cymbomonas tetramitiformis]|uniref:Uncharacterized protein n=1 Tax=Cymbomonas tetramitiformis TaxID=36881 RepID=A0AAE0GMT6_9CHLO|nr:hypothetical protein CYMTET_11369 [Cymbomonas tetramitiformis]